MHTFDLSTISLICRILLSLNNLNYLEDAQDEEKGKFTMFIQPLANIKTFEELAKISNLGTTTGIEGGNEIPFKSFFQDAIQNVRDTDAAVQIENQKLALGQTDDIHTLNILSSKATMALTTVIELRNKGLDAYNEIMRMGV